MLRLPGKAATGLHKAVRTRNRLLFILSSVYADGGIQRFNRTLLAATDDLDIDFDVYSLGDSNTASVTRGMRLHAFRGSRFRFSWAVFRAVLRGNYAAIVIGHVNFVVMIAFALCGRLSHRPPVLLIAHGLDVWTGVTGIRRRALRLVTLTLCVSHYTQTMIQRQAPEIDPTRLVIFPNALDRSWNRSEAPREHAHCESSQLPDLPRAFLLSVSRLSRHDRYKGIITIIETLPMLDDTDVHYVVAGAGDDTAFLSLVARRNGVLSRVHFLGSVSDNELIELYRRCAVFVLPSGQEGFGLVFLEAMYFGAPVIAAAEKGALDVVQHESTGLTINFGDVVSLKYAIDRMLEDENLRAFLRRQAHASVSGGGMFTFQEFSNRWRNVLGNIQVLGEVHAGSI